MMIKVTLQQIVAIKILKQMNIKIIRLIEINMNKLNNMIKDN